MAYRSCFGKRGERLSIEKQGFFGRFMRDTINVANPIRKKFGANNNYN